jgi:hypothetical protein
MFIVLDEHEARNALTHIRQIMRGNILPLIGKNTKRRLLAVRFPEKQKASHRSPIGKQLVEKTQDILGGHPYLLF